MKKYCDENGNELKHPVQPVYLDGKVARFMPNAIVRYLLDNGGIDMNHLALRGFEREDYEQFAQLIGYSVGGFADLSYASDDVYDEAYEAVERLLGKKSDVVEEKPEAVENNDVANLQLQINNLTDMIQALKNELHSLALDTNPVKELGKLGIGPL